MDKAIQVVLREDVEKSAKREALQTVAALLGNISAQPKRWDETLQQPCRERFRSVQRDDLSLKLTPGGWALLLVAGFAGDGNVLRYPPSRDGTLQIKLLKLTAVLEGDLEPDPVAEIAKRPAEEEPVFTIADPVEAIKHLVAVQRRECPGILEELEQYSKKRTCWMWWICPHEREGGCDPECTRVTRQTASRLCESEAAEGWRAVLEKLCDLAEADGMRVLPSIDHGRVCYFLEFWRDLPQNPEWMTSVLKRLGMHDWRPTDE